jgi:hypothetical protein
VTPDTLKIRQSIIILLAISPLKKGLSFLTARGRANKTTSAGPMNPSDAHEAVSACLPTYAHVTLAIPNSKPVNKPSTTPCSNLNFEAPFGRLESKATPPKIKSDPSTCHHRHPIYVITLIYQLAGRLQQTTALGSNDERDASSASSLLYIAQW